MVKIKYSGFNLYSHLFTGVILISVSLLLIYNMYSFEVIISLIWLILGIYTISQYVRKKVNGYLQVLEDKFIIYDETKITIEFIDIKNIQKFAGDIIIYYANNKVKIDTSKIDEKSLDILNTFINKNFSF